jgi:excisionase family DNA binding protein
MYLGCSVWAVRDLLHRGAIAKVQLGKRHLIDVRDIDAFVDRTKAAS